MNGKKIGLWLFTAVFIVSLFSCTTGNYMTVKSNEKAEVLGNVQATFFVTGAFRYRKVINTQAYINLLTAAQEKFPDVIVDIRDITWAIGQGDSANNNYVYVAAGKAVAK